MSVSRSTILLAMVILVLSASGCDPGYKYDHVDTKGERLPQWSETVEGVRFSARPYRTLIGESSASINLDITNESNQVVVVLGGQLLTNGLKIEAIMIDEPLERASKTVHAVIKCICDVFSRSGIIDCRCTIEGVVSVNGEIGRNDR